MALDHGGYDGLEFDVQLAKCGTPVLFHDDDLTGIFGVPGEIKDYAVADLKALEPLDLDRFDVEPEHMQIPTLEETLKVLPDGPLLNIELKSRQVEKESVTHAAAQVMGEFRRNYLVSSFNPLELIRMSRLLPDVPRALLFGPDTPYKMNWGWPAPVLHRSIGLKAIHPNWELVSYDMIQRAHEAGLQVNVWTVNDPERAAWLEREGIDALITDELHG